MEKLGRKMCAWMRELLVYDLVKNWHSWLVPISVHDPYHGGVVNKGKNLPIPSLLSKHLKLGPSKLNWGFKS
jgi:hypothetical protein